MKPIQARSLSNLDTALVSSCQKTYLLTDSKRLSLESLLLMIRLPLIDRCDAIQLFQ